MSAVGLKQTFPFAPHMSAVGGKQTCLFAPALLLMGEEISQLIPNLVGLFRDHLNVARCGFLILGKEIGK